MHVSHVLLIYGALQDLEEEAKGEEVAEEEVLDEVSVN